MPCLFLSHEQGARKRRSKSLFTFSTEGSTEKRCVVQTSHLGHQLPLPPANCCPIFASRTTQCRPVLSF